MGHATVDEPSSARLAGLRVLVVEDVAALASRVHNLLTEAGAEVIGPVSSIAHALAPSRFAGVDVALLDMNLHTDFAKPIADELERRSIPFVFLTGFGFIAPHRHHARPILSKPIQTDVLIDSLVQAAASRRA